MPLTEMARRGARRVARVATLLALLPQVALAHAPLESPAHWWTPDPWIVLPGLLATGLYSVGLIRLRRRARRPRAIAPWRAGAFYAAVGSLFLALVWPLEALSGLSLAAHMSQHMLLITVAPPLLVLARPMLAMLIALPRKLRARLTALRPQPVVAAVLERPAPAFVAHALVIWAWHAPAAYEAALHSDLVHVLEHAMFLGTALVFWRAVTVGTALAYPAGALWTLGTLMHTGLLGAILTFAPVVLYPSYPERSAAGGLTTMEDQQLAGLIMWVPGGAAYTVAAVLLVGAWLRGNMANTVGGSDPRRQDMGR